MRTTRLITVLAVSAGLVVAAPATALAQEPVTVTLSPEQVQRVCEQRIPRIERRVAKARERITAGPEVRGSVKWLEKRAEAERAAGRETTAEVLAEKAERRAARGPRLEEITARVAKFRDEHCAAK
ncbi:hypothetical protein ACFPM7_02085 [Actinokineospora guangxiensis]|uniref:Secreted protein n=1 Tax=Actinokineospora guangxiensis TaxID=1490288 RepID=A0ABW0EHT2_9PSEU